MKTLMTKTKAQLAELVVQHQDAHQRALEGSRTMLLEHRATVDTLTAQIARFKNLTTDERVEAAEHDTWVANEALENAQGTIRELEDDIKALKLQAEQDARTLATYAEEADDHASVVSGLADTIATLNAAFVALGLPAYESPDEALNIYNLRRAMEDANVLAWRAEHPQ